MGMKHIKVASTNHADELYVVVSAPAGEHKGYIQLVHDRYDHVDRYKELLSYYSDAGYVAFAADMIGHGKSVSPDKSVGCLGGEKPAAALVDDINSVFQAVIGLFPPKIEHANVVFKGKKMTLTRPTLRCLVGIGFGCALVRNYTLRYKDVNALVLCGDEGFSRDLGKTAALISHSIANYGEHAVIPDIRESLEATYLDHIEQGNAHRFSYRTSRPSINHEIANDPLCAFDYDLASEKVLLELGSVMGLEQWTKMCPSYLPVYMISGYDDPVTNYTRELDAVLEGFKYAHAVNVFFKYFEGSRHDVLLDRDKKRAWKTILTFVENINNQSKQMFEQQKEEFKA